MSNIRYIIEEIHVTLRILPGNSILVSSVNKSRKILQMVQYLKIQN